MINSEIKRAVYFYWIDPLEAFKVGHTMFALDPAGTRSVFLHKHKLNHWDAHDQTFLDVPEPVDPPAVVKKALSILTRPSMGFVRTFPRYEYRGNVSHSREVIRPNTDEARKHGRQMIAKTFTEVIAQLALS